MASSTIHGSIKLTGWKSLKALVNPAGSNGIEKKIKKEVGRATKLNARLVRRAIRQEIKGGSGPALAPLTVSIKRSKKRLIDHGDLWKAVTSTTPSWDAAFVGVLRTARGSDGGSLHNLAVALHEGETIPVTLAMRNLFWVLHLVSDGRLSPSYLKGRALDLWSRAPDLEWFPLGLTTTHIIIPGAPFIKSAVEDPALLLRLKKNWEDAVARALKLGK